MEEHLLLRVPDSLKDRLSDLISSSSDSGQDPVAMSYECTGPGDRDFVFTLGNERYYATLQDLPCIVETHRTTDKKIFYKSSEVGQVLQVHDVLVGSGRPQCNKTLNSGLTAPTDNVLQRYKTIGQKSQPYKDKYVLDKVDIELLELEAELTKRERSAEEYAKPFVYEELVIEEPFMQYWDDVTVVEMGKDGFESAAKQAYDLAYNRYEKRDKQSMEKAVPQRFGQSKNQSSRPAIALIDADGQLTQNNVRIERNVVKKSNIDKRQRTNSNAETGTTMEQPSPAPAPTPPEHSPAASTSDSQEDSMHDSAAAPTDTNTSAYTPPAEPSPPIPAAPEAAPIPNKIVEELQAKLNELRTTYEGMQENVQKLSSEIQSTKNKMLAKRKEKLLNSKKDELASVENEIRETERKLSEAKGG